ncbi:hypothetical protein PCE1_004477 [Barthelona sp. PCE]
MGQWFSKLFSRSVDCQLLVLGLDKAGKTSVLQNIRTSGAKTEDTVATVNMEYSTFSVGRINFTSFDVGGQERLRHTWRHYYLGTESLLFVIDAHDRGRFSIARSELENLVSDRYLANTPIVILANKQDLQHSTPPDQLGRILDLHALLKNHQAPWTIIGTSAKTGMGLDHALDWIYECIN